MMFYFYFEGQIDGHDCEQKSLLGSLKELDVFVLLTCVIKSCKLTGLGDMLKRVKVTYILFSLSYIVHKNWSPV